VLAVAMSVARRQGLAPPIPVTLRFADAPSTHESEWQELVVRHLGLTDWERIELTDELDLLGDMARTCLAAHGLFWPPNAFLHIPIFRLARHGTVLTGVDGDGLLGDWRWRHAQSVLHGHHGFRWRHVPPVALALAPEPLRRPVLRRRPAFVPEWLQPGAQRAFSSAVVQRAASEPRRWDDRVRWYGRSRALWVALANLNLMAANEDVRVCNPLFDRDFLAAVAAEGGAGGIGDRTQAMRHLFGDHLPEPAIERPSKAQFGPVFWREQAREFATSWSGDGVDTQYVRSDGLRRAWAAENPIFHSWTLLQAAWLAGQAK
jgi:asparagine synthase (glutamine-hydrolysing)